MSNGQKTPFARSLEVWSARKINDAMQQTGRALPCVVVGVSGAIITVSFQIGSAFTLPQVDVPLFGPEYIRYPIQVGDKGCVFAADARLGAMSGLGGGVADLTSPANLGALVFFPIGNKQWPGVDPNSLVMYGPGGVKLYDTGQNSTIILTPSAITITGKNAAALVCGSNSFVADSSGCHITGPFFINGAPYLGHEHSGVQSGASNTGGVV